MMTQQEALIKQIGSMVQAFATDRARDLQLAFHEMRQQLAKNTEGLRLEANEINKVVSTSVDKLQVGISVHYA